MKKIVLWVLAITFCVAFVGCAAEVPEEMSAPPAEETATPEPIATPTPTPTATPEPTEEIELTTEEFEVSNISLNIFADNFIDFINSDSEFASIQTATKEMGVNDDGEDVGTYYIQKNGESTRLSFFGRKNGQSVGQDVDTPIDDVLFMTFIDKTADGDWDEEDLQEKETYISALMKMLNPNLGTDEIKKSVSDLLDKAKSNTAESSFESEIGGRLFTSSSSDVGALFLVMLSAEVITENETDELTENVFFDNHEFIVGALSTIGDFQFNKVESSNDATAYHIVYKGQNIENALLQTSSDNIAVIWPMGIEQEASIILFSSLTALSNNTFTSDEAFSLVGELMNTLSDEYSPDKPNVSKNIDGIQYFLSLSAPITDEATGSMNFFIIK
ncbi:hypothetical protein LJC56_04370 [Christensenellaceae bacterium OttesenSCG-928-K19]|nr:hypothetical protein [Christensenellaceae bacterium OttesenSCG-928-K19]